MKKKGSLRAAYGQVFINHKGRRIPTSVGSDRYEGVFSGEKSLRVFPSTNGNIPIGYAHRPDLIANLFLNTSEAWWIVCERNAVFDVFEQLKSGTALKIPVSL
jgi:hypothetical protein